MGIWVEESDFSKAGDVGFLVRTSWIRPDRKDEYTLQGRPLHTNMSGAIILDGWAGTTDDVAKYAYGVAEVVKVARNGRALIRELSGKEAASALRKLGYEDLANDVPSTSSYTVDLPSDLYEKIGAEAKAAGKTINDVIVAKLSKVGK